MSVGPGEVMVTADSSANPVFAVSDLLVQGK